MVMKQHAIHSQLLIVLFISIIFYSCSPRPSLKSSLDLARERLSGPSYTNLQNNEEDVKELNIGIMNEDKDLIGDILTKYGGHASLNANYLLVSTDTLPGPIAPERKFMFLRQLSLFYGVQLIGKGGKSNDGYGTSTTKMTYLEPVGYVLYNYNLPNDKGRLFGGPGLYIAYGLWGKSKYDQPNFGSQSYPAFDKNTGYQRFDAGLAFTGGYELPIGLRLSLEYELGLVNIAPGGGGDKTRNRVVSLNVAYSLKKLTDKLRKKSR